MRNLLLRSVLRSLKNQKLYTSINVLGLNIGILSFSMIMLYVMHEASYDKFHSKADRIYRLTSSNKERAGAITPYIWGVNMMNDFPEVENYSTLQILSLTAKLGEEVFAEDKMVTADSTFFELFDFPTVQGNVNEFLKSPDKIVITPQTAQRYFPDQDPIGKSIEISLYGTFVNYEIQGIVECPKNSHLQFDFIIPIHLVKRYFNNPWAYNHWRAHFVSTYLLLAENTDLDKLRGKFKPFLFDHAGVEVSETYTPDIQPLADIYQKSDFGFDFQPRGNEQNSRILRFVAFGILIIAIINFINITSAQSLRRAKEVSIKKVLGTRRSTLVAQFIGESMIVSFIAALFSIFLILLLLPYFNAFTGKEFLIPEILTRLNIVMILILTVVLGVLSGLYPALLLSSFKSVSILSSRAASRSKGSLARKLLVVIQFSLGAVLLISTGVIYNQVRYMQSKDLGFDKEQILVVNDGGVISSDGVRTQLLRGELTSRTAIHTVSGSSSFPGKQTWSMRYIPEGSTTEEGFSLSTIFADHDFLKTFDVEIIDGRDLDRTITSDSTAFLIDESAVRFLTNIDESWEMNPLGKELNLMGFGVKDKVIGVFKDFHFESLRNEINPLIINVMPTNFSNLQMRVSGENMNEIVEEIESVWQRLFPEVPFNYSFVDKEYASYLAADKQLGNLLQIFTILSVIVAVLGLFGLASFLAFEKAKEMSIRKVIGASENQLVFLLAWLFLRLVVVANLIAIPVSYFLMDRWLAGFAYRDAMPFMVYLLAVLISLFITLLTVAYHATRTATINPVTILAQE